MCRVFKVSTITLPPPCVSWTQPSKDILMFDTRMCQGRTEMMETDRVRLMIWKLMRPLPSSFSPLQKPLCVVFSSCKERHKSAVVTSNQIPPRCAALFRQGGRWSDKQSSLEGWTDVTAQTLSSKPPRLLLEAPLSETVLTGSATNESAATPKLAVSVLVAKDTMWFVPPTFYPHSQLNPSFSL